MTEHENTKTNVMTDEDRTELRQRICKTELTAEISKALTNLAKKYEQPKHDVEKEFYNVVCEPRFDIYEEDDERFDVAFDSFTVEFTNTHRKQEPVYFMYSTKQGVSRDESAEHLYNSINGITIFERMLNKDDSVWEVCINDTGNELEGKMSLTAKQMLSFASYKLAFFNTFHFPIAGIKVKWDEILVELVRNKANVVKATDSDLMDEAKSVLDELCKLSITSTEGEIAGAGKKIFEQRDIYFVTTKKVKEICDGLKCKYSSVSIGKALVEMGIKIAKGDDDGKHLGVGTLRCWWFKKDIFDTYRKGKYRNGRRRS